MPDPVEWIDVTPGASAALAASPSTAGTSTCPGCGVTWTVTPARDCMLPACGCYGHDTGPSNPARPCEACGLGHAFTCPKMPGRA